MRYIVPSGAAFCPSLVFPFVNVKHVKLILGDGRFPQKVYQVFFLIENGGGFLGL